MCVFEVNSPFLGFLLLHFAVLVSLEFQPSRCNVLMITEGTVCQQYSLWCRIDCTQKAVFEYAFYHILTNFQSPTNFLITSETYHFFGIISCLKAEGIFRINAENSQEENVRKQLNKGVVPCRIDVHCLAGLIKVSSAFMVTTSAINDLMEKYI